MAKISPRTTSEPLIVKQIPINQISTDNQLVRSEMDDDHVIELASSISSKGLLQPIVCAKNSEGSYQLIAGAHRLAAAKRLKWNTIDANLIKIDANTPVKSLALIENITRKSMILEEEVNAVIALYEDEKKSPSEICQLTGKSRAWVNRRLALPQLDEEAVAALFDNRITLTAAELISTVNHIGIRRQILNEAIYGQRTNHEIKQMVDLAKATPSLGEAIKSGVAKDDKLQATAKTGRTCEACGDFKHYSEIQPIWVCSGGCKPPHQENEQTPMNGSRP